MSAQKPASVLGITPKAWRAQVTDVHDGDTLTTAVVLGLAAHGADHDYGFHIYKESDKLVLHADVRLLGCNAIELRDAGGVEARDHLLTVMPIGTWITLTTEGPDKYGGRYDAAVTLPDGSDLVQQLIAGGWAAAWNGQGTKPAPAWPIPGSDQ
jgi:endonuclease YncB( thermonuclease family)